MNIDNNDVLWEIMGGGYSFSCGFIFIENEINSFFEFEEWIYYVYIEIVEISIESLNVVDGYDCKFYVFSSIEKSIVIDSEVLYMNVKSE